MPLSLRSRFPLFLLFLLLQVPCAVFSQSPDTLQRMPEPARVHSPRRASIYSAVLPGAGQVYNRQYWKAPLIWGGLAYTAYHIGYNKRQFQTLKNAYVYASDTIGGDYITRDGRVLSAETIRTNIEVFRRNRDYSYFFFGLIYLLNIVDAAVYAHLFYFEVDEDISLNIQPYNNFSVQPAYGIRLTMNF